MKLVVVNHIGAMGVEQREHPPKRGGQTPRLAADPDHMSTTIDIAGLVEVIRNRDLLAAPIA
jgi:hypothetical protein